MSPTSYKIPFGSRMFPFEVRRERISSDFSVFEDLPVTETLPSSVSSSFSALLPQNAHFISVDAAGKLAVLASKRGALLMDLDNPFAVPENLMAGTQSEILKAKFHPSVSHRSQILAAQSRNVILHDIQNDSQFVQFRARVHDRNVTDIAWNPVDPNLFATCSSDSSVNVWDSRHSTKKVTQFCSWTTSAHHGEVRVWDMRGVQSGYKVLISAHESIINGMDWSYKDSNCILTSAEDFCLKTWDTRKPQSSTLSIDTGSVPQKARFCPFGDAFASINSQGSVNVWKNQRGFKKNPVETFSLETSNVRQFDIRVVNMDGHEEFQMCMLSKDQSLSCFHIEETMLRFCGESENDDMMEMEFMEEKDTVMATRPYPGSKSQSSILSTSPLSSLFEHEIMVIQSKVPLKNVMIERGTFIASVSLETLEFDLFVQVSCRYPSEIPQFEIPGECALTVDEKILILNKLKSIANDQASQMLPCLIPCFQWILSELVSFNLENIFPSQSPEISKMPIMRPSSAHDDSKIICPPLSCAIFGPQDQLVYFNNTLHLNLSTSLASYKDFKTATAQFKQGQEIIDSNSDFESMHLLENSADIEDVFSDIQIVQDMETSLFCSTIAIKDLSDLGPIKKELVKLYKNPCKGVSSIQICHMNLNLCNKLKLSRLVVYWKLCATVISNIAPVNHIVPSRRMTWSVSPLGAKLATHLLDHFEQQRDVQSISQFLILWRHELDQHGIKWSHGRDASLYAYADILFAMGEMDLRLQVLKCLDIPQSSLEFSFGYSDIPSKFYCAVCRLSVKGIATSCGECGHGGHLGHMSEWFSKAQICALGCGCYCKSARFS